MKNIIKKVINYFGFNLIRVNKEIKNIDFNDLLKQKISSNPIIFDVGGNSGQSILKFKKIFKNPIIHSFEPIKSEYKKMEDMFACDENVFLNNFALGEKEELKEFNITAKSSNSSFNKIKTGTNWLKKRKEENLSNTENFIIKKEIVKINTIDKYCLEKKIDQIDLIKIDTQGYEDKVLQGSKSTFEKEKVKAIVTEIMFDNVYEKYFSFSDIEKHVLPFNFRMVGIDLSNNNLFTGLVFFADVYYFNKKYFKL